MMHIIEKYQRRIQQTSGSLLCIGLDSRLERLPLRFLEHESPLFAFNRWIIEQTHTHTLAYKPNLAFYEGVEGYAALTMTMNYLRTHHSDVLTIADAKRADIGASNEGYARSVFDALQFDAITLNPYLGKQALSPFLERADKGCIILCRTSNPGADEFQELIVGERPLWLHVAEHVAATWNSNQNCMLVVGATQPEVLAKVRAVIGEMPILVPGVGAQGGDLAAVLGAGLTTAKAGLIINASRSIIYADDPQSAAVALYNAINSYR